MAQSIYENEDLAGILGRQDRFDAMAFRLDPERARCVDLRLDFEVDETPVEVCIARQTECVRFGLNVELDSAKPGSTSSATLCLAQSQPELLSTSSLTLDAAANEGAKIRGGSDVVRQWLDLHDRFDRWFNVETP
ncbi:MAG: hypothetical protein OXL68_02400 [Paracoccaceae bacterium]|nr:hypothetical protein [Paracoccaceae bacterium]